MHNGLSVPQGAALTLGAVLGTGVISLPALAAGMAGPASLVAWAAWCSCPSRWPRPSPRSAPATPTAAACRRTPASRSATGRATVVGWCFYFAIPSGAPTAAGFAGAYVADASAAARATALRRRRSRIIAVVAVDELVRPAGVRHGAARHRRGARRLLLAVAMVVALPHAELANLTPFAPHGWARGRLGRGPAGLGVRRLGGGQLAVAPSTATPPATSRAPPPSRSRRSVCSTWASRSRRSPCSAPTPGRAPLSDLLVLGFGESARPVTTVVAVLLTVGAINAYFAGGSRTRRGAGPRRLRSRRGSRRAPAPARPAARSRSSPPSPSATTALLAVAATSSTDAIAAHGDRPRSPWSTSWARPPRCGCCRAGTLGLAVRGGRRSSRRSACSC